MTSGQAAGAGHILVVDDEPEMVSGLRQFLTRHRYTVSTAGSAEQALERLREGPVDLVLTDLMLPGASGLDLLERVKAAHPETLVVLITGYATVETAVQAIRKGAFDYISKPFTPQQLEVVVNRVFQHKALADENRNLRGQIRDRFRFDSLVGLSEEMKRIQSLLARVSATDASVMVFGESGTGKELIARAIHANSRRAQKPFVPLDCAALPHSLLESELFGYEKGAFTGAVSARTGLMESAHGGTFFMDEIGELELTMQVKLLRVLQERQFRRVGGSKLISVDVRVIAATNRDLSKEVKAGRFREDLFHRLHVIPVKLPPLRERVGDVSVLVHHFLQRHADDLGKPGLHVSPEALQAFEAYRWPGNVRELNNAVEYAASLCEGERIELQDLPPSVLEAVGEGVVARPVRARLSVGGQAIEVHHDLPYKQAKRRWLETFEREYFLEVLKRHDFNISHAAREAGVDRKSIQRILKRNGMGVDQLLEEDDDLDTLSEETL